MYYSVGGLLVLILDIFAWMQILQSSKSSGEKLLWFLVVLFLPLLGPILWFTIGGDRSARDERRDDQHAEYRRRFRN